MRIYLLIFGFAIIALSGCQQATPEVSVPSDSNTIPEVSGEIQPIVMEDGVLVGGMMMVPSKTIAENITGSKDHTSMIAAFQAAEHMEILRNTEPITVFAPTNSAFSNIPADTIDSLLAEEDKTRLTDILDYHIVSGKYGTAELTDGLKLETNEGKTLTVSIDDEGAITLTDAKKATITITTPDIESANGVIHSVDTVMMPR